MTAQHATYAYIDDAKFDQLVNNLLSPAPSHDRRSYVIELLVGAGIAPELCLRDPHRVPDEDQEDA